MKKVHMVSEAGEDSVYQHIFQTVGVDPLVEDEVTLVFSLQKKKRAGKKKRCEKKKGREAMENKTKHEVTAILLLYYTSASKLSP